MAISDHSGIRFDSVVVEKVVLQVNPAEGLPEGGIGVSLGLRIKRSIDKAKRVLSLKLEVTPSFENVDKAPMDLSVILAGAFSLEPGKDIKELERFSEIQGPALLFPFAREVIANLTVRTQYPALILPPTNILALLSKRKKGKTRKIDGKKK